MAKIAIGLQTILSMYMLLFFDGWLVGWSCLTSRRQRGHLETPPSFTVLCEGRGARFLHRSLWDSIPAVAWQFHYTTAAPRQLHVLFLEVNFSPKQERRSETLFVCCFISQFRENDMFSIDIDRWLQFRSSKDL